MSGFITASGENYLLSLVANAAPALPVYYFALVRAAPPTRFVVGSELDEPGNIDYARAEYANSAGQWTERSQFISNTGAVLFPPAATAWGRLKSWAICDQPTGGRVLWAGDFPQPITVAVSTQAYLPPGTVTLSAVGFNSQLVL